MKTCYSDIMPYVTKDGSEIREFLHSDHHGVLNQSLAEAIVPSGTRTLLHQHHRTEEIYHVTAGRGLMTLGNVRFEVDIGDSILIPPCTAHSVEAIGSEPLRILCCCSPAYAHDDTELLGAGEAGA